MRRSKPISFFKKTTFIVFLFISFNQVIAQNTCYSTISDDIINDAQHSYQIFDIVVDSCKNKKIKSTYFAIDAFEKYEALKADNKIFLVAAASYTSSIHDELGKPVGFCSEEGQIHNKMPNDTMDGLVLINNQEDSNGDIEVVDLDEDFDNCKVKACDMHSSHLNIRENPSDTYHFIKFIEQQKISSFQTHLVYTYHKSDEVNFSDLNHGSNDRGRRFLVIAEKDNVNHHLVVDHISVDYLMAAVKRSFDYIVSQNYSIKYILNLDTGNKDIIHASNGSELENLRPNPRLGSAVLERAASLIVYYSEK